MTRDQLAYNILRVLVPTRFEAPELFRENGCGVTMLRHYQLRRWPKLKLCLLIARIETLREG